MDAFQYQGVPKVELHRHLEGAIRPSTILDLYQRNRGKHLGARLEELIPRIQMMEGERSFSTFLGKFNFFMPCIASAADLARITSEAIEDCAADGIIYSELRFAPSFIQELTGLSAVQAVEAVLEGARVAKRGLPDIIVNFIAIILQPSGEKAGWDGVRLAADYREAGVRGVDIAADTTVLPLEEYLRPFAWARANGLGVTVHAGESEGPDSVRTAIEKLGAPRVGHGVRAVEDPRVASLAAERGTLFEVCLTSNVQTGVAADLQAHPLPRLMEMGVKTCLNTDDPGISGITLSGEYARAAETWGMGAADFAAMNAHALEASFGSEAQRKTIRAMLDGWSR